MALVNGDSDYHLANSELVAIEGGGGFMVALDTITTAIVAGLKEHLQISNVIEMDQPAPKPLYPFVGFKWVTTVPEAGTDRKTVRTVSTADAKWDKDIEYRYVRNPVMTMSLTVYDKGNSDGIHTLTQSAHTWFSIPELGADRLEPTGAVILDVSAITGRDTVLDREIERRQGFDVRLRVVDVVTVTVPTIERVIVNDKEVAL